MCGLYGYKTRAGARLTHEQATRRERALRALALAMETRGDDSTGLAYLDGKKWKLLKRAECAGKFLELPETEKALRARPSEIIGHTRLATIGDITDGNAHPFKRGKIIGAHNGSVYNYLEIDSSVSVDSEVIFKLLAENGQDFKKTFKRLSGSFAITWTDGERTHFVRKGNPLHCAYVEEIETLFWASEMNYLAPIMAACGFKYKAAAIKESRVYTIGADLKITEQRVHFKKYELTGRGTEIALPYHWSDKGYSDGVAHHWSEEAEEESYKDAPSAECCHYCGAKLGAGPSYWSGTTDELICSQCWTSYGKDSADDWERID